MRIFNKFMSYLPLGWLVLFGLFVLRARIKLGYMPSYNNPDPKNLGMVLHYNLALCGLYITILSVIYWIMALIIDWRKVVKLDGLIFLIAYVAIMFLVCYDVWGLVDWLTD